MEKCFEPISDLFHKFDNLQQKISRIQFNTANQQIEAQINYVLDQRKISNHINEARLNVLARLNDHLVQSLAEIDMILNKASNSNVFNYKLNLNVNAMRFNQGSEILICCNQFGRLIFNNEFLLFQKVKYSLIFDFFEVIEINFQPEIYGHVNAVLPLCKERIFYSLKSKDNHIDYLKIINRRNEVLYGTSIVFDSHYFSNYLACKDHIAVMHNNFGKEEHCFKLFNSFLKIVNKKTFKAIMILCFLNENEIVFYKKFEYLVYNFKLEQIYSTKESEFIDKSIRLDLSHLIGLSKWNFFFKTFDAKKKCFLIKSVDRKNTKESCEIISINCSDLYLCDLKTNSLFIILKKYDLTNIIIVDLNDTKKLLNLNKKFDILKKINLADQNIIYYLEECSNKIYFA